MQILDVHEMAQELCRLAGKPGILFNFYDKDGKLPWEYDESPPYDFLSELTQAAPWLNVANHGQTIIDTFGFVLCEDDDEADRIYQQTVGDDGPTDTNPYDGPVRVYVLTINAKGELGCENT